MPRAITTRHELDHGAVGSHQKVSRNAQVAQVAVVRMRIPVQFISKELDDGWPPKFTRRQADAMNHQEFGLLSGRSSIEIGRDDRFDAVAPSVGADREWRSLNKIHRRLGCMPCVTGCLDAACGSATGEM